MNARRAQLGFRSGMSLVEVSVGLLVFTITALGSAYYRYATTLSIQIAQQQLTGADLAATFVEAWQGLSGSESFGPVNAFSPYLTISSASGWAPDGYTLLGAYDVAVGDRTYRATLYWQDVESDLRELGVAVSWSVGNTGQDHTYRLTAYARR